MLSLPEPQRRCSMCGEVLPLSAFVPRKDRPEQVYAGCRDCRVAYTQRWRASRQVFVQLPLPLAEKTCSRCHVTKPLDDFDHRGDGPGLRSECRLCRVQRQREYNESHREQKLAAARRYYQENKGQIRVRNRVWAEAHPEKYRLIHSGWKRRNREAVNASTHKRRARLRANGGSWTASEWERLKAEYNWRCLMCGRQKMTDGITLCFDHVIPLSLGGWNIISNGQPLCRSCNSLKHQAVLDLR